MRRIAVRTGSFGPTVTGRGSSRFASVASSARPFARTRVRRSRSVKRPTSRPPSVTSRQPAFSRAHQLDRVGDGRVGVDAVRRAGLQPRHRIDPDVPRELHRIQAEARKGRTGLAGDVPGWVADSWAVTMRRLRAPLLSERAARLGNTKSRAPDHERREESIPITETGRPLASFGLFSASTSSLMFEILLMSSDRNPRRSSYCPPPNAC